MQIADLILFFISLISNVRDIYIAGWKQETVRG